ncbi:retrovirus-related pol polyprotein from transposon TNT 1-94 [Tanacetum coccineum]
MQGTKLCFKTKVVVQDVVGRNTGNVGGQNRGGIINPGQAKPIKCYNYNGLGHIARECPRPKRLQDSDYFKDKMLLMQAQESGAVLDEEQSLFLAGEQVTNVDDDVDDSQENDLALNVDHIFEADECDAFDSDVDEGPTSQTMFMANLTSEDPIYDEAGPSYDSNNPFEVQDHDACVDNMDEYHDEHEMQNDVQHNYVVDSDADYTSDSNIIPYDQYVEDNEEHVVQCNASSVRNDALMSIFDEMHEQGVQSRLANKSHMVVNDSVTSELARYKELVGEYEKRAKFELTDRERKIDEQMRIIISDRNRKETSLKSELHSAQILLSSTVDHYKSKTEEVTLLKKDFKQKEDKFLEEFLDIKKLKDKIEDRLYKQGQSVQTVHMLCQPKSFYDEKHKVAIGYKNPLCLTRAKQVQPALYNGHVGRMGVQWDEGGGRIKGWESLSMGGSDGFYRDLSWHFGDGGCSLGVGNEGWRDTEGDSVCKTMYNTTTFEVHDHDHDPFEVQDHDAFVDHMDEYHEVHEMQNDVQHNYVVDFDADYMSNSNIIPYDQYVEDNEEHVVQCNASSIRNDALMTILDEMHENGVQSRLTNKPDMVMNDSVTSELVRYKELVGEYEKRAKSKRLHWKKAGQSLKANTKKNRILPAKKENKKEVELALGQIKLSCIIEETDQETKRQNVDNSLNKTKQIWKPKSKLSDNSLSKTQRVWKATGKLFADIGYQWRPTGKKLTLGKLDCGSQWRPTGKKFALGEMCHLTKLSVKCRTGHALVSGLRLLKTYDGESFKAHEFCGKVHRVGQFLWILDLEVAFRKHTCFVHDLNGTDILKDLVRGLPRLKFEKDHLCSACQLGKSKKFSHRPKSENTNMEVLHTLHMDLCGSNGDETPEFVTNFLKQIQVGLNKTVRFIRTDNGMNSSTKLFDETSSFCTEVSAQIVHQVTSLSTTIAQDAPSTSSAQSHRGMLMQRNPKPSLTTSQIISERWTLDHPTGNIIGNPSRLYSTRKQLASMLCGDVSILKCPKSNPRLQNGRE